MIRVCIFIFFVSGSWSFSYAGEDSSSSLGPADFDWETINLFKKYGSPGVMSAFLGEASLRSNERQLSFYANGMNSISAKFLIGNYSLSDSISYTLLCMVDYSMMPCFNGDYKSSVQINRGETSIVDLLIPVEEGEASDFLVLALNDLNFSIENSHLYHRAVIYSDPEDHLHINPKKSYHNADFQGKPFVVLSNDEGSLDFSYSDSDKEVKYLKVGSGGIEGVNYKIIIVLWDDAENVYSVALPGISQLDNKELKTHDIQGYVGGYKRYVQAFVVYNPFINLEVDGNLNKNYVSVVSTPRHEIQK